MRNKVEKFQSIFRELRSVYESKISWSTKYDLIFGDDGYRDQLDESCPVRLDYESGCGDEDTCRYFYREAERVYDELCSIQFEQEE